MELKGDLVLEIMSGGGGIDSFYGNMEYTTGALSRRIAE